VRNSNLSGSTPIAGKIFPDGAILDLVLPPGSGDLRFVVWDGRDARVVETFKFGERVFRPARLRFGTVRAVRFPSGVSAYGSVRALFDQIAELADRHFGVPDQSLHSIAYWAISSWFPELLPAPTTLIVNGPSAGDGRCFLRFLRCVCRRGLVMTEVNPAGFLALPRRLRPTLLIDQPDITKPMRSLFRAASGTSAFVTRKGRFLDVRCVKAVFCRDAEAELAEGSLRVAVGPPRPHAPIFDGGVEDAIANELQPKLLRHRLESYAAVTKSDWNASEFTTEVRDLARGLAMSVGGDPDLAAAVLPLLAQQDEEARARWTTLPEFAITVVLLALVHERKESQVLVKKIAKSVNATLCLSGELSEFSPEEIGYKLAALGLFRKRTAGGMVIRITREISRQAHGLNSKSLGWATCAPCLEAVRS